MKICFNYLGKPLRSKYNIILVSSGEDCIDRFIEEKNRGNKIHLILLDYRLLDMFGDTVARKIKDYNGTKIILISAYNFEPYATTTRLNDDLICFYI
jgi:CheY-like chemotaxis protein